MQIIIELMKTKKKKLTTFDKMGSQIIDTRLRYYEQDA